MENECWQVTVIIISYRKKLLLKYNVVGVGSEKSRKTSAQREFVCTYFCLRVWKKRQASRMAQRRTARKSKSCSRRQSTATKIKRLRAEQRRIWMREIGFIPAKFFPTDVEYRGYPPPTLLFRLSIFLPVMFAARAEFALLADYVLQESRELEPQPQKAGEVSFFMWISYTGREKFASMGIYVKAFVHIRFQRKPFGLNKFNPNKLHITSKAKVNWINGFLFAFRLLRRYVYWFHSYARKFQWRMKIYTLMW